MRLPLKVDGETGVSTALVLIIAKRDFGKTTLAIALQPELAPKDKIALVDPQGTLAVRSGIPRYRVEPTEESSREFLEKVLRPAEKSGHGLFLMIDEADRFMTTRSVVGGQQGPYFEFINVSRGWGMGGLLISHGAGVTSKNVMEQADLCFLGNTTETNALRVLAELLRGPTLCRVHPSPSPPSLRRVGELDEPGAVPGRRDGRGRPSRRRVAGTASREDGPEPGTISRGGKRG